MSDLCLGVEKKILKEKMHFHKIVHTLYIHVYLFKLLCNNIVKNPWLNCVQKIVNSCGRSYEGQNHCQIYQFIQLWYSNQHNSSKTQ